METALPGSGQLPRFESRRCLSVAQILQTYPYWRGAPCLEAPRIVRRLAAGLSNECYLLQAQAQAQAQWFVLRINAPDEASFGLSRAAEEQALQQAARAGIGPQLVCCSAEQGFLVTRYIEGKHWTVAEAQNSRNIDRLVRVLKRVHALPQTGPELSVRDAVDRYWFGIAEQCDQPPRQLSAVQDRMARLIDYADSSWSQRCFCHNDLMLANILDAGDSLRLLDWEYAAVNDPFFDLAVIAHNHQLDDVQCQYLLTAYAGSFDRQVKEHFSYSYTSYLYLDVLWYWLKSADQSSRQSYQALAVRKMDTLLARLHQLDV